MHKRGVVTTQKIRVDQLVNSDNPRYTRDSHGQWWYKPIGTMDHPRTRAYVKACKRCSKNYLASIFHRKFTEYCSRVCSARNSAEANPGKFSGDRSGNWKGGRRIDHRGYALVWAPGRKTSIYMFEHRLVMEKILGRQLLPGENVHHKNGIRDDNRPENLELWAKHQPPGQRLAEQRHCTTCTCSA